MQISAVRFPTKFINIPLTLQFYPTKDADVDQKDANIDKKDTNIYTKYVAARDKNEAK